MLEIYAIAGGDWLRGNLNAIAAFMGTSTWSTIEKMCIAISVLIVAGEWGKKNKVMDLFGWGFFLTPVSMLVVICTPVPIIDYS
ncbi:conjugal transfer protein TraG N-terminal domain-containing protein, partial [Klebsiella pneumoniae]|uniref:conjugal transfer protein TraG N-terminal domain-containing protein n=1 Tax=Klebsiella pneumoniae TaxID=573 RepID=UPI003F82BC38